MYMHVACKQQKREAGGRATRRKHKRETPLFGLRPPGSLRPTIVICLCLLLPFASYSHEGEKTVAIRGAPWGPLQGPPTKGLGDLLLLPRKPLCRSA